MTKRFTVVLGAVLAAGCSMRASYAVPIEYLISRTSVVNEDKYLGQPSQHVVEPGRVPLVRDPVVPFVAWGLWFDEDIMISLSGDPGWGMIEVSKIVLPSGRHVWFTLDSKEDGRQFVGLPDDPLAAEMAKAFPAPSYNAGLIVKEVKKRTRHKTLAHYEVSYRRIDGAPIRFELTVDDSVKPSLLRNGHAMNHSQGNVLALVDLASMQLVKSGGFRFIGDHPRRAQSLLTQKIAGVLRQAAAGLRAGSWKLNGASLEARNSDSNTLGLVILGDDGRVVTLGTGDAFPSVQYDFAREGESLGLREIRVDQSLDGRTKEVARIRFNPALPDLRYGPPSRPLESRMVVGVNGQSGYQMGVVRVERDRDGSSARISVLSRKPSWAKQRPVVSFVRYGARGVTLDSAVLSPGASPHRAAEVEASPRQAEVSVLRSAEMVWRKRPHRVGTLEISSAHARLTGGPWANGSNASDEVVSEVTVDTLRGADFWRVMTPVFPMVNSFTGEDEPYHGARASGVIDLTVRLPEGVQPGQYFAFLDGFGFDAGPLHRESGANTAGFHVGVGPVRVEGDSLRLRARLAHQVGDVPERRSAVKQYSALGWLHLVIVRAPEGTRSEDRRLSWSARQEGGWFRSPRVGRVPAHAMGRDCSRRTPLSFRRRNEAVADTSAH